MVTVAILAGCDRTIGRQFVTSGKIRRSCRHAVRRLRCEGESSLSCPSGNSLRPYLEVPRGAGPPRTYTRSCVLRHRPLASTQHGERKVRPYRGEALRPDTSERLRGMLFIGPGPREERSPIRQARSPHPRRAVTLRRAYRRAPSCRPLRGAWRGHRPGGGASSLPGSGARPRPRSCRPPGRSPAASPDRS